tara:strand:+ start:456 stop:803 length:348 start_codon:yes stop_codon:yes gene_type:complete
MTNFDQAIEKLLRRIQRAASKNKWKKVDRLTQQLNQLQDLAEQQEQAEEQAQSQELPSSSGSNSGSAEGAGGEDSSNNEPENRVIDHGEEREDISYEDLAAMEEEQDQQEESDEE